MTRRLSARFITVLPARHLGSDRGAATAEYAVVSVAAAGLGGILLGFTQQVSFQMGFQILLLIFAAVTLGGLGTIWGAIVGSLVVGLFLQLTTLVIPTELKSVGALLVLIVILLVRPYGLLGRRERVG